MVYTDGCIKERMRVRAYGVSEISYRERARGSTETDAPLFPTLDLCCLSLFFSPRPRGAVINCQRGDRLFLSMLRSNCPAAAAGCMTNELFEARSGDRRVFGREIMVDACVDVKRIPKEYQKKDPSNSLSGLTDALFEYSGTLAYEIYFYKSLRSIIR